jgi:putative acetyltransferase
MTASAITIAAETPDQPAIHAFFAASEAYMGALYPAESNHFVPAASLVRLNVVFLVARRDGAAVGCGAVVDAGDRSGEIKRMWVDPGVRGQRVGARLLAALEAAALTRGLTVLRLETGVAQPEALGLYRAAGFISCGPFSSYAEDPLSIFMEKTIRQDAPA